MTIPPEVVADAVARVAPDGRLLPGNAAMAVLATALGPAFAAAPRLDALPLPAADLAALAAGEAVDLVLGQACHELQLRAAGSERWLVARDVTAYRRAQALAAQAARARALAAIAQGLSHDLANALMATVGVAEHALATAGPDDRAFLQQLLDGARRSGQVLTALGRALGTGTGARAVTALGLLVREAAALCERAAHKRGRKVVVVDAGPAHVRTVPDAALQALLQCGLLALADGEGPLTVACGPAAPRNGRAMVEVRFADRGPRGSWQQLAVATARPAEGLVVAFAAAPDGAALLQAWAVLRRDGGDLAVQPAGADGARSVACVWPAVRA